MKLKIQNKMNPPIGNAFTENGIKKDMPIAQIVAEFPNLAEILTEDYGFHCVGCFASTMETLEQGGAVHGMTETEIEEMVAKLNKVLGL